MANLEPVVGSEQGRTRPCVVMSDLALLRASRAKELYTVVPLTTSEKLVGPLAPRVAARAGGLPLDSTVLVMHVRTIDPARIVRAGGTLTPAELEPIRAGLRAAFGL